jgi:hypothetical protein
MPRRPKNPVPAVPLLLALLLAAGCATAPAPVATAPAPPAAAAAPAPGREPTLAEQIHETVAAIDEAVAGYDAMLLRIQSLPPAKNPAQVLEEVGTYVGGERLAGTAEQAESQVAAGVSASVSVESWIVIAESEILPQLVDLSRRLVRINGRTEYLAGSYEQGRTLQRYSGRIRRELMPLMARLRALAVADKTDADTVARLNEETRKIVSTSRERLRELENATRNLEEATALR